MVKVEEETNRPGPDWNRRLKRLLLFEVVAAVFGLVLFYGYLDSPRRIVLTGLSISSGPQLLAPPEVSSGPLPAPASHPAPGLSRVGGEVSPGRAPEAKAPLLTPAPEDEARRPDDAQDPAEAPADSGLSEIEPPPAVAGRIDAGGRRPGFEAAENSSPVLETDGLAGSGERPPAGRGEEEHRGSQVVAGTVAAAEEKASGGGRDLPLIQVGDFVIAEKLAQAATRLERMGLVPRVVDRVDSTPMYRVYLGPFQEGRKALALRSVSRRMGDQPFLEKRPEGYFLIVSSFYLKVNVAAWLRKYRQAGYDPRVMRERLPVRHRLLLVDASQTGVSPKALLERLRQAGFSAARECASSSFPGTE